MKSQVVKTFPKTASKIVICIFYLLFVLHPFSSFAGTKIIDYGFEDWNSWSGTSSPADGWIFTQPADTYFYDNSLSTIGTTGCSGDTPYEGSYYYHTQFNTSSYDPCLGRTSSSVNHRMYIGYNGGYPTGTKNIIAFPALFSSDTETLRFRFRVTDDWTSAQTGIDGGGGMKWIRQAIGRSYFSDGNNILIKLLNDGDSSNPRIGIYQPNAQTQLYSPGVNWQDGNWHSFTMTATNTAPLTYDVAIYMDDWDMERPPFGRRTITMAASESDGFYSISLNGNWSAKHPPNLMGMDYDNFEVWDELPNIVTTPPPVVIEPPHVNTPVSDPN